MRVTSGGAVRDEVPREHDYVTRFSHAQPLRSAAVAQLSWCNGDILVPLSLTQSTRSRSPYVFRQRPTPPASDNLQNILLGHSTLVSPSPNRTRWVSPDKLYHLCCASFDESLLVVPKEALESLTEDCEHPPLCFIALLVRCIEARAVF